MVTDIEIKEKRILILWIIFVIMSIFCIIYLIINIISNNEPYELLEKGYPKDVVREPYSFTSRNIEEETQLKEFLGIYPPGDDMDTWLSRKDLAGLEQWKDYWFDIFGSYGRADLLTFIDNKFVEYKSKI